MREHPGLPTTPIPPSADRPPLLPTLLRIVVLFVVLFLPVAGLLPGAPDRAAAAPPLGQILVWSSALAVLHIGLLALVMRGDPSRPRFGLRLSTRDLVEAALIAVAALAVVVLGSAALAGLPPTVTERLQEGYRWQLATPRQLPLALVFALTGAYREELFFRSYLVTKLEDVGAPPWVAVAVSSALFAAGHIYQGVLGAAVAALLGLLLGTLFLARRAVHRLALGHAAFNLAVLSFTLLR